MLTTTVVSSRHHKPRGIVSSIVATGHTRLVINEDKGLFVVSRFIFFTKLLT